MLAAQQRNYNGAAGAQHPRRRGSDSSSEDSMLYGEPIVVERNNRQVYNGPIGGTTVVYAPPAMPAAPLSYGVRP